MKLCILAQVTSVHLDLSFLRFYPIYHFGYFCVLLQNVFILLWYSRFKGLEVRGKKIHVQNTTVFFSFVQNCLMMSVRGAVSFFSSCPSPSPSHPSRLLQSPCLSFWDIQQIPIGYLFYIWYCKFTCYSPHTFHPLLHSPHVHKSILYVCFSIAVLQITSSVPCF